MASFQTFFRAVVMLAVLGFVAKAWYLYGPSVEMMKSIGLRVTEVTSEAWNDYWESPTDSSLADDPRVPNVGTAPAPFVPPGAPAQPMPHGPSHTAGPPHTGTVQLASGTPAELVPVSPTGPSMAWPASAQPEPMRLPPDNSVAPESDPRLTAALERLAQLGMRDQELSAWGSRGDLMRFSCNMPWANSPAYSRHFEAVAATPLAAVEQVAMEIEAWQRGQR